MIMATKKSNEDKLIYSENVASQNDDVNNEQINSNYNNTSNQMRVTNQSNEQPNNQNDDAHSSIQYNQNTPQYNKENYQTTKLEYEQQNAESEKQKKERNWIINTGNMAIIASSLSLMINVIHKLLRLVLVVYGGLIVFLYILAGIFSVFALFACIKYGFKSKQITLDAYLTGISFIALILI